MVNLRRPSRSTRNTGFSMKYFVLLVAATILLVFWAYQRLYFGESAQWLLMVAILLAVWAFGIAFFNVYRAWRRRG